MSTSLILVLFIVVWLFVLAPLVVNTREPIRRTSDALGKTRLLHRGGDELESTRRRPTLSARDVRHAEDVDESLETVDPVIDDADDLSDVLIDDDPVKSTKFARKTAEHKSDDADGAEDSDGSAAPEAEVVDGDVVYELESAGDKADESDNDTDADAKTAESANVDGEQDSEPAASAVRADEGASAATAVTAKLEPMSADDIDVAIEDAIADELVSQRTVDVDAEADSGSDAVADVEDESTADADSETDIDAEDSGNAVAVGARNDADQLDDELTEDDYAFAERRRGRGGFDPVSDAKYAATRFERRRRSVAGLVALIVILAVAAFFIGGWAWWMPLVGVGLLTFYLVTLRRTVMAEQELRARRIRRMKMSRLGVRNNEDEELGIPDRLRRPGAVVVEIDDEAPEFADLPYGEFDDYDDGDDYRRAVG